jgi:hypothetical protein
VYVLREQRRCTRYTTYPLNKHHDSKDYIWKCNRQTRALPFPPRAHNPQDCIREAHATSSCSCWQQICWLSKIHAQPSISRDICLYGPQIPPKTPAQPMKQAYFVNALYRPQKLTCSTIFLQQSFGFFTLSA